MVPGFNVRSLLGLVLGLAGTLAAGGTTTVARGAGCPCRSLADEFQAADAGLVREWIVQVPFDSAAWRLDRVVVGDGLVLVRSGDGGVHAIRGSGTAADRAGTVAWSRGMPASAGHSWPPTAGSRLVIVTTERDVQALDPDTGDVQWEKPTGALTIGPAVQSGRWVYVPLDTGRIIRLPAYPSRDTEAAPATAPRGEADLPESQPAEPPLPRDSVEVLSIDAGGHGAAPVPLGGGVLWSTEDGLVALVPTRFRWLRHRFPETTAPNEKRRVFLGPPVVHHDGIFIVTADGVLARILLNAPQRPGLWAAWSRPLPDRPTFGPLVRGDTVLVSLGPSGIAAFAVADGDERWRSDIVGTIVAAAGGRAWVLDETGRLTALDLASGMRRGSWCIGCLTLPVVNTASERIVLASPTGLVVSLAPPAPPVAGAAVTAGDPPADEPVSVDPDATPP